MHGMVPTMSQNTSRVDWAFVFQVMGKLGMPNTFLKMVRILFHDATNFVNINTRVTESFGLHKGVHQGCPLTPYLFIITAEALNATVKHAMGVGNLKGH